MSYLEHGLRRALVLSVLSLVVACGAPPEADPETSVKPGINRTYLDPELQVDAMVARFEVESREIAASRDAVVAALGLEPGMDVADVGAGTGLFLEPLANEVGPGGSYVAVDIAEPFIAHLAERAAGLGLEQVSTQLCAEDSVELPAESVDLVFVCDTYHHFEYPRSTTTSIHSALRDGGELFVVDFERIPGVTRPWLLEHVRAGKQTVIAEIESFGFEFVEELKVAGLEENYAIRFRKR
ncbi:MAG: class I SAM-dependent methyltransferase [Planctomycetota bacterium]|jgi:ubiquinone/menaquinone biosynthesis C-methylase UbiE